jgi:rubrerythrin
MSLKRDAYACAFCLLIFLVAGLYLVWEYFGSWPFVVAGAIIGGIVIWAVYNSRKARQVQQMSARIGAVNSPEQEMKVEKFEREQQAKGLAKYVGKNGNIQWGTPEQVEEWTTEDKVRDAIIQKELGILLKKEVVKVRCPYCGELYDEQLSKCPNCGASR